MSLASKYAKDVFCVTKRALVEEQRASSEVPVPHFASVIKLLIAVIERVEKVKTTQECLPALVMEIAKHTSLLFNMRSIVQRARNVDVTYRQTRGHLPIDQLQKSQDLLRGMSHVMAELKQLGALANTLYTGSSVWRSFYTAGDAQVLEDMRIKTIVVTEHFKWHCLVTVSRIVAEVVENPTSGNGQMTNMDPSNIPVSALQAVNESPNDEAGNPPQLGVIVSPSSSSQADDSAKDDDVLEELPHADATADLSYNLVNGTRVGVLDDLDTWADGRDSNIGGKFICNLTGRAGTGKSTVASEFARRLRDKGRLGASFSFAHNVDDLTSPRLFFSTIAYQLAQSQAALRSHIAQAVRNYLKNGTRQQMRDEVSNLLRVPLHAAAASNVDQLQPIVLVIDGLDHCLEQNHSSGREMLKLLISCAKGSRIPIRILLTSRTPQVIHDALAAEDSRRIHTISFEDIALPSVNRDIERVLREGLGRIPSSGASLSTQPLVFQQLAKRAGGLFAHARTAVEFLSEDPGQLAQRIKQLLENTECTVGGVGPLDGIYSMVLQKAFPNGEVEKQATYHARVQAILGLVALLRDPLSPNELAALSGISMADASPLLYNLRSLVHYNPYDDNEKLRPTSATLTQFLLDGRRCTNKLYFVDLGRESARLARGCLRALFTLVPNPLGVELKAAREDVSDLRLRLDKHVPVHVQYACLHWATHLSHSDHSDALNADVKKFVTTAMTIWIETLAWMGRLDVAEVALNAASRWLLVPGQSTKLLEQAIGKIQHYHDAIAICPGAVYDCGAPRVGSNSRTRGARSPSRSPLFSTQIHPTTPEPSVENERLGGSPQDSTTPAENPLIILLSDDLKRNMCSLSDPSVARVTVRDIDARVHAIPESVRRACKSLERYLRAVQQSEGVSTTLCQFVHTKMAVWIETLAWMGCLDVVDGVLEAMEALVTDTHTQDLLRGVGIQVRNYHAQIQEQPDLVYRLLSLR